MKNDPLYREALALRESCAADRRFLHRHAETGFELKETHAYVFRRLEEIGLNPRPCGRCGITCALGRTGKTVLLRADMDALPLREESGLPFSCENGCMHACGHDMHTAMLIAAAQLLKAHEAELNGTVKLMFQPAEELLQGAKDMIDSGVLENPPVDAALMLHVITGQPVPAGSIIIPAPGVSAPAAGTFSVRILGKGCHGAAPQAGIDPVTAAANCVLALQEILTRELAPHQNAALTIGCLQSGNAANAIPSDAVLRGSWRAFDDNCFEQMRGRIEEICAGIARVYRCEAQLQFHGSCPTLINDAFLAEQAGKLLPALPGGAVSGGGSEDFAWVSHRVPALMLALAAGHPDDGYTHPLHHPGAKFDERALIPGAFALARLAMRLLQNAD